MGSRKAIVMEKKLSPKGRRNIGLHLILCIRCGLRRCKAQLVERTQDVHILKEVELKPHKSLAFILIMSEVGGSIPSAPTTSLIAIY